MAHRAHERFPRLAPLCRRRHGDAGGRRAATKVRVALRQWGKLPVGPVNPFRGNARANVDEAPSARPRSSHSIASWPIAEPIRGCPFGRHAFRRLPDPLSPMSDRALKWASASYCTAFQQPGDRDQIRRAGARGRLGRRSAGRERLAPAGWPGAIAQKVSGSRESPTTSSGGVCLSAARTSSAQQALSISHTHTLGRPPSSASGGGRANGVLIHLDQSHRSAASSASSKKPPTWATC